MIRARGRRARRSWLLAAVALGLFAACERDAGSFREGTAVRPAAGSPLSLEERRTTHGKIALGNLDGEIEVLEASVSRSPGELREVGALVDALLTRAVVRGRLADYDRAHSLAEPVPERHPGAGAAFLVRARTRAALHRFAGALADLETARSLGASSEAVETLRLEIVEETGDRSGSTPGRRASREAPPDILRTGKEAVRAWRRGDAAEAERLFAAAQHQYEDVSPFPFAWLYLRQGMVWEEIGDRSRARELFEAALARVPGYAPAVSRLAGVEAAAGRRARAIGLLGELVATSDDPEYEGQLAQLLHEAGDEAAAERHRDAAAQGFEHWLERHPDAFAAKASRFWRDVGGDPARALELARRNLAVRRTPADQDLVAAAEEAVARRAPAF